MHRKVPLSRRCCFHCADARCRHPCCTTPVSLWPCVHIMPYRDTEHAAHVEQGQRVAGCVDHSPATAMLHGKWPMGAGAFHGGSSSNNADSMAEATGHWLPPCPHMVATAGPDVPAAARSLAGVPAGVMHYSSVPPFRAGPDILTRHQASNGTPGRDPRFRTAGHPFTRHFWCACIWGETFQFGQAAVVSLGRHRNLAHIHRAIRSIAR